MWRDHWRGVNIWALQRRWGEMRNNVEKITEEKNSKWERKRFFCVCNFQEIISERARKVSQTSHFHSQLKENLFWWVFHGEKKSQRTPNSFSSLLAVLTLFRWIAMNVGSIHFQNHISCFNLQKEWRRSFVSAKFAFLLYVFIAIS